MTFLLFEPLCEKQDIQKYKRKKTEKQAFANCVSRLNIGVSSIMMQNIYVKETEWLICVTYNTNEAKLTHSIYIKV